MTIGIGYNYICPYGYILTSEQSSESENTKYTTHNFKTLLYEKLIFVNNGMFVLLPIFVSSLPLGFTLWLDPPLVWSGYNVCDKIV